MDLLQNGYMIFGLLFLMDYFCIGSLQRIGYNGLCTKTSECEPSSFTICKYGRCQCPQQNENVYDKTLKRCAHVVGAKCVLLENGQGDTCITNAKCSSSKVCKCNDGFKPSLRLTSCVRQSDPSHLQLTSPRKCRVNGNCDVENGLICLNGLCQCFKRSMQYDPIKGCYSGDRDPFSSSSHPKAEVADKANQMFSELLNDINSLENSFTRPDEKQYGLETNNLFSVSAPIISQHGTSLVTDVKRQAENNADATGLEVSSSLKNVVDAIELLIRAVRDLKPRISLIRRTTNFARRLRQRLRNFRTSILGRISNAATNAGRILNENNTT